MPSIEAKAIMQTLPRLTSEKLGCNRAFMVHQIETLVAKAPVQYVVGALKRWNANGNLDWESLENLANGTYVKDIRKLGIHLDDDLWVTYDIMEPYLYPFPIWDLKMIHQMSVSPEAVVMCPPSAVLRDWFHNFKHYEMMKAYNELR